MLISNKDSKVLFHKTEGILLYKMLTCSYNIIQEQIRYIF